MTRISQAFKKCTLSEPPYGMQERILMRIDEAAEKSYRADRFWWGAVSIASIAFFSISAWSAGTALAQSDFMTYVSLIFSDTGSIGSWWKELGLSIVESLPMFAIALTLAGVAAVGYTLSKFLKRSGSLRYFRRA